MSLTNKKRKHAGHRCVYCLQNKESFPDRKYHRFPSDEEMCKKWLAACNKPYLLKKTMEQLYNLVVCSDHFKEYDYCTPKKVKLIPEAVPCFNSCDSPPVHLNSATLENMRSKISAKLSAEQNLNDPSDECYIISPESYDFQNSRIIETVEDECSIISPESSEFQSSRIIESFQDEGSIISWESSDSQNSWNIETSEKEKSAHDASHLIPLQYMDCRSRDFERLFDTVLNHDVQLKCGNQIIFAHKSILVARSEVFADMLKSNMSENQTDCIDFSDLDTALFMDFVHYLYTRSLKELTVDKALKLYECGEMYCLTGLMKLCSNFLVENLSSENAFVCLAFADAHSDQEFKDAVMLFIRSKEMYNQDALWLPFCDSNPKLALEVLNRFCRQPCYITR